MQHSIIEFKARCSDHERIRGILQRWNARFIGADHQLDTYFHVPNGRLKLREGKIENALVFYVRPNKPGAKQSQVTLAAVPSQSEMKSVLAAALGVMVVVDKHREIYFLDNVKVHLDEVAGLGAFVEVEAIGEPGDVAKLQSQCEEFQREFGVQPDDMISESYSDLLLAKS